MRLERDGWRGVAGARFGGPGAAPGPLPSTYVIRPGDSLPRIARNMLGDAGRWREIFEANADAFTDPNSLTPGQVIRIPATRAGTRAISPSRPLPQTPEGIARAQRFVDQARRFIGQPFRWGGGHGKPLDRPGPVDCSGLVSQAARTVGVKLEGSAAVLQKLGRAVPMNGLRAGDLLFVGTPALDVAIYVGAGRVLHADRRAGKVVEGPLVGAGAFDNARRVI